MAEKAAQAHPVLINSAEDEACQAGRADSPALF